MDEGTKAALRKRMEEMAAQGATKEQLRAAKPKLLAEVSGVDAVAGAGRPQGGAEAAPGPSGAKPWQGFDMKPAPPPPGMLASVGGMVGDAASAAVDLGRAVKSEFIGGRTMGAFGAKQSHARAAEGLGNTRLAARAGAASPSSLRQSQRDYDAARTDLDAVEKHPIAGVAADVVGGISGVGAKVSRGIDKIPVAVSKGFRGKLGLPSNAQYGRDVVSGGVGGAVEGAGRSVLEGDSARDAVDKGAFSGLLGAAAAPFVRLINAYLRDPRSLTGKQIQALKRGAEYIGTEEFQALDDGLGGVGQLSTTKGRELGELQAGKFKTATDRIKAGEEAIGGMDEAVDVGPVHKRLDESVVRFSQGRPVRPDVEEAIGQINTPDRAPTGIKADLSRDADVFGPAPPPPERLAPHQYDAPDALVHQGVREPAPMQGGRGTKRVFYGPDPQGPIADPVDASRPMYTPPSRPAPKAPDVTEMQPTGETTRATQATPRDLIKSRRKVRALSEPGMPSTPQNAPYREIYGDLADATHSKDLPNKIGEQLAATDARFAEDMEFLAAGNARIFGPENPRAVTDSVAAGRAAGQKLSRAIGDTHAAGMRSVELDELADLGPEYREAIDRVKTKIAYEGTRMGFPRLFSHSGNWLLQPLIANFNAVKARGLEPLTRAPGVVSSQVGHRGTDLFDAARERGEEKRKKKEKRE